MNLLEPRRNARNLSQAMTIQMTTNQESEVGLVCTTRKPLKVLLMQRYVISGRMGRISGMSGKGLVAENGGFRA